MPVMKAQSAAKGRESAIVMDLSDLEREAVSIVANARAEAARLVEAAKIEAMRDCVAIREMARAEGQREGFAAGREAGEKIGHDEAVAANAEKLAQLMDRWTKTLDVLHQHMPAHVADAKTDLVKLALAIAERVTRKEGLRDRKVTQAAVEETLRIVGAARKVAVRVHPDEAAALEAYMPELLAKARTIESAEIVADALIMPGGCETEFGAGAVDARLETQIARISDELLAEEGS